jgi:hypothetical protein
MSAVRQITAASGEARRIAAVVSTPSSAGSR